jgi:hypothetical protein
VPADLCAFLWIPGWAFLQFSTKTLVFAHRGLLKLECLVPCCEAEVYEDSNGLQDEAFFLTEVLDNEVFRNADEGIWRCSHAHLQS